MADAGTRRARISGVPVLCSGRSRRARALTAYLLLTTVMAALVGATPRVASAAPMLVLPAAAGTEWTVLAGYNTATHSTADKNDPYALDMQRTDALTDGTPVLAPMSGTVSYVSSTCLTIRDAAGTRLLMCHILASQALRNTNVARGQYIATVAPAGMAGNNGTAHIHMALSSPSGAPVPFAGAYALEGTSLPATAEAGAYTGVTFRSSMIPAPTVEAGSEQLVRPRATVALSGYAVGPAGAVLRYQWTQVSGSAVTIASAAAPDATFTAPAATGTLQFRLTVTDDTGDSVSDTVTVRVSTTAAITQTAVQPAATSGPASTGASASIVSGSIPASGGFGLVVFGGGTSAQLVAASACPAASSAFWASTADGRFVTYVPGTTVSAVNQAWLALFASGIPSGTPLIGRCR